MILRTPPPKRPRQEVRAAESPPLGSEKPLVIYEDNHSPVAQPDTSHQPSDHLLCTYQCRQMVKADFLDALRNAEKQVLDDQSKLEELNENFCKAEAERKKFRDQFLYAEQELAAAKKREEVLQQQLLKEVNDSQERLKKQLHLNNELTAKFQNEMNLRMKAESAAATAGEKATVLDAKLSQLSESTEKDQKRLHSNLTQLERELKFSVSRNRTDLERMECRAKNAEKESELLKEQLEDLTQKLEECLNQKSEAEKKLSSFTFQEVTSAEHNSLIKHLQEELKSYEYEVREAKKLKSYYENVELLKEKLLEEKGRRERAESELCKLQELPLRLNNLEKELSMWKQMMNEIPGVSRLEDIPNEFAVLQKEVLNSTMKIGEVNLRLKQMEVALDAAQLSKQTAETESALANEKAEVSKSEVKRMELMLLMVTEERDKLRNVISELKTPRNIEPPQDSVADRTFLQELESSLATEESFIKELNASLCEQKELNARQRDEIKALNERLISETRRIKSLERESDRLHSEISLLESKLGHGDFSSANTKVLRMVNTLGVDSDAKQTIEALQTELQKTKEKLQAVEELKSQSGDTGKLVDSYISEKIVKLKEQIAILEKREERYKTVFADRISVFRRACCELFGYKIVMDEHQRPDGIPVTHFSLQSIYALSDDEKLEFEYESGNTKILASDYTSQREISQQVEIFIRKMNSIPAFTANLTIESFNKRTLS